MLPDGLVGNYAANCVQDFGDGMANAEVELNLKPQVSSAASVIVLWSVEIIWYVILKVVVTYEADSAVYKSIYLM